VFLDPRLKQKIPEFRRKHKEIFLIDLSGQPDELRISPNLLIRPLTRQEFLFLQSDIDLGCDPTEELLKSCMIWPEIDWANDATNLLFDLPYMCFDGLAKCIIDISGFSSNEQIAMSFNNARIAINSLDSVMLTVISRHFQGIDSQKIDNMTLEQITKLFAIAETSLEQPIDLRLFLDEKYAEKQMRAHERKQNKSATRLPNGAISRSMGMLDVPEGWNSAESTE
jgi:hypothetical protein